MFTTRTLSKPQLRNLTYLLTGIFLSRSVHLNRIANKIPGRATLVSATRRLSRFLDGPALAVRPSYESLIRPILARLAQAGDVHLIVDGSKVGFHHQLLMVSVAYRRRAIPAIPVAWTWLACKKGHSSPTVQIALLDYVRRLLPVGVVADLVGDCEFGAIDLITQLEAWGWTYVLRQKPNHRVQLQPDAEWLHCASLVTQPGQSRWLTNALLTALHRHPTHVVAHWAKGESVPWLLATNHLSRTAALKHYARRMWTEELFGDLKDHGFELESSHLDSFLKLSRLTLAVVLIYVWLVACGSQTIKRGLRYLVDRADRRDLSIFQIGLRFLERCLTNDHPVPISFLLVTTKLSGG